MPKRKFQRRCSIGRSRDGCRQVATGDAAIEQGVGVLKPLERKL